MGIVLFIVGFLLFVGLVCWLGRGKPNDHNSTHGDGGTGSWSAGP
jgi:hypothetical protein